MSRKREPYADVCEDGYRIVRHTHDVELAREMLRVAELKAYGCPGGSDFAFCENVSDPGPNCPHLTIRSAGRPIYTRITRVLPNSPLSDEYAYLYKECAGPGRGAFKAVEFR